MNLNFVTELSDEHVTATGLTVAQVKTLVTRLKVADLESRSIYIEPTSNTPLPSNAVVVATSYPFGSHKCVRVLFSEWRDKHGYRTVTATSNKSHTGWNAMKNGTYTMGVCWFGWDENSHAQLHKRDINSYSAPYYAKLELSGDMTCRNGFLALLEQHGEQLSASDKKLIEYYLSLIDKQKAQAT